VIVDREHPSLWIQGGKSTKLREVPLQKNLPLIYRELGVYKDKLGTPCDEL
jgi:hypothetical protein